MFAAAAGNVPTLDALLAAGAYINQQIASETESFRGWTALAHAAANGQAQAISALLRGGADPNLKDDLGQTALMRAVSGLHEQAIQILIVSGCV